MTLDDFFGVVRSSVPRFQSQWLDREQERVVSAPPTFVVVVADLNTGKSTALDNCATNHVFRNRTRPAGIIATRCAHTLTELWSPFRHVLNTLVAAKQGT